MRFPRVSLAKIACSTDGGTEPQVTRTLSCPIPQNNQSGNRADILGLDSRSLFLYLYYWPPVVAFFIPIQRNHRKSGAIWKKFCKFAADNSS